MAANQDTSGATDSSDVSLRLPTEPIGSLPRNPALIEAFRAYERQEIDIDSLDELAKSEAIVAIRELEATGSPCITDGEQRKFNGFAGYVLHGAQNLAAGGRTVHFDDGHQRSLPMLTSGPFAYARTADNYLTFAKRHTQLALKQAVISPSLLSLIYPPGGLPNYSRDAFIADLLKAHVEEVRRCLDAGAECVQIDFTEARLSLKLDDSGALLDSFVDLINRGLSEFSDEERLRIGVHTCPGNDLGSTHSADVDYKFLLPALLRLDVGRLYVAMAAETHRRSALRIIKNALRPSQTIFIGVTDARLLAVETVETVRDRLLEAAAFIPADQLGSTDDCGFSPFADNQSGQRAAALEKIRARVAGTALAEQTLLRAGGSAA